MLRVAAVAVFIVLVAASCDGSNATYRVEFIPEADNLWRLTIGSDDSVHSDSSVPVSLLLTATEFSTAEVLIGPVALRNVSAASVDGARVVSRVLVERPWYATDWLIAGKFSESIPEYDAVDGLLQKIYVFAGDGRFGGVYFWESAAAAAAFYDTEWHDRINARYGAPADLVYWELCGLSESAEICD